MNPSIIFRQTRSFYDTRSMRFPTELDWRASARRLTMVGAAILGSAFAAPATADEMPLELSGDARRIIETHCGDCHRGEQAEAGVRFDDFEVLSTAAKVRLLNRAQDQVFHGLMPPADAEQLGKREHDQLANWLRNQLRRRGVSELDEKLRHPAYGNYVDHTALFDGSVDTKPFTYARRWLVSPQIFHERVNDVFRLKGRSRQPGFYGVTNPFVLPDHSGVRDYDIGSLDGGHLLVMLSNAKWIAEKQVFAATRAGVKGNKPKFSNPKDRWYPRDSPAEFVAIVDADSPPSEQQMVAAIRSQFEGVLNRQPNAAELQRYSSLLRKSIKLGGNTKGLQQMLVAVLLESEFLYRQELGAGEPDESGRRRLAPSEAAQAIAYAIGDRGPGRQLKQAAAEGRLHSKEDYRREVERLLGDASSFRGAVDPALSGRTMQSHVSTHPKLVRFFREFFGYPSATKVFKDVKRSDGFYENPSRGTSGTPGFLVKEADRIVDWVLMQDVRVFESLLTTEDYFVYHNVDNARGRKIVEEWAEAYERLKDTDWKKNPERVIEEHREYIASNKSLRILGRHTKREFLRYMQYFTDTLGRGRTPFTTPPFQHGNRYNHSTFYSLPPSPPKYRYNRRLQADDPGFEDTVFWDYPVEQPFRIEHRRGLLTHPAWLIAHSGNFQTDPIRRGRWIREKLLAGSVPDVPITVDAKVPDDPHKTFRERVEQVTTKAECWKCHQHMNPLGMPFEAFDDFGRYRMEEPLESPQNIVAKATDKNRAHTYRTRSVSTVGALSGAGDATLEGEVADAMELIDRLAGAERVRQSFIRHAFRFFLGRNEMPTDSRTLIEADKAYVDSGGSFRAVVVSLLTSDSFRYRVGSEAGAVVQAMPATP